MKITKLTTYPLPPRWLFLRVDTDEGIVGWGEPVIEGRAHTVAAAVAEMADYLVGKDPRRIEDHWQVLSKGGFYRGGPILSSAVAGIDQALWDIAGKRLGVPTYELLGGPVRDTMRVYSWIGGDDPADVAAAAQMQVDAGFTAVKMNASGPMVAVETATATAAVVERVRAVREVLGPDRDLAVDFHGRISPATARRLLPLLAPFHPLFVEEPVLPEFAAQHLAGLVACSPVPIATGERCYSRWDFVPVLAAGVAVVQPDVSHSGGISETRRIAAAAETAGATVALHCPLGPIALASCLQLDFATPNVLIQEQSLGIHYNVGSDLLDYLVDRSVFAYADGAVARSTAPGLGIEVDEKAVVAASALATDWHNPIWRHADGSFAEW